MISKNFLGYLCIALFSLTTLPAEGAASRQTHEADYVIIGGGTAGCALAAKLSDPDPSTGKFRNSVIVLEAGVNLTKDPAVLGNNIFETFGLGFNPKYSKVTSSYLIDQNGPAYLYTDGRMWGGSSGHNGLQAYRGTPNRYNQWASISGDKRWSYNNLLENVMLPMEHYTPTGTTANPTQRGSSGPLFITQEPPIDNDPFMIAVSKATKAPLVTDLNDPDQGDVGIGANQNWVTPPFLGRESVRSFAGNSYLTGIESEDIPAIVDFEGNGLDGRKLQIVSNAVVSRIIFSSQKARSVEYILSTNKEEVLFVKANKKIILCAGAIQDAVILQRSGIGDAKLLESLGIPVVYANSNVGANMQAHYGPQGIIGGVTTTVTLPEFGSGFIDLPPSVGVRRYQLVILDSTAFFPTGITNALGINSGIGFIGFNMNPKSLGSVQIVSRDPFVDPIVNSNVFTDGPPSEPGTDANLAIKFYKELKKIARQSGGTVLFPPPEDYRAGDEALFADAFNTFIITYHNSGTCRMAKSPRRGVVDGQLNVFGVKGLKIASCSVAPVIEDGNTGYQAYVIGLEAANIILEGN